MSKQIKISEIENKMTGFEQIPISAEFEKEPEWCDEKGLQAQSKGDLTINIVKFKAAAPPIEGSAHEVRIVVRAQKGTIRNGDFMKEDPKAKVFTISPQGVGGSARVTVYYRPPRGEDNSDILTVLNSCDVYYTTEVPLNETTKGTVLLEAVELCNVKGYAGTINVIKSWEYKKNYKNYAITYVGNLTSTISGIFKPVPQMEGMEGQPVKIFGRGTANGTWRYNEQTFCEGDCDCEGMTYEEYGSGSYSSMNLDGIMIITNLFPTDIKVVADQLSQFGMENWYDIMIPHETVKTQSRTRMKNKEGHCEWNNSNSTTVLTECSVRFKLSDIKTLNGNVRWGSKSETTTISITDLTEAIYDQKPFDPERDGNDYTYTITWNLKAI